VDIPETAAAGGFSTLVAALEAAELVEALSEPNGPFTVFAPSDDAFGALPAGLVECLLKSENVDVLQDILLYHVARGEVKSTDLTADMSIETLNGVTVLSVDLSDGVKINDIAVETPDIMASNGVIHAIEGVLVPPGVAIVALLTTCEATDTPVVAPTTSPIEIGDDDDDDDDDDDTCQDAVDLACNTDDFSILCSAIKAAGLDDTLSSGNWTIFAPTNKAFEELHDFLGNISSDGELLKDVLLFHAIEDAVKSSDLKCKATVEMQNGQDSRTVCRGSKIYQKGGSNPNNDMPEIIQTDIKTCQGYIHVVDEVMLPNRLVRPPPPKPGCKTVVELVCESNELSTLCSVATQVGLFDTLSPGELTLFAPDNAAFEDLGGELDSEPLTEVLKFHVVENKELFVQDLKCGHSITMANGKDSRHICRGDAIFQKGGGNPREDETAWPKIIDSDIGACDGVIHIVDTVMLPKNI